MWGSRPCLPGPFPGSPERKTDPETVTVNQLPVGEDNCVPFAHIRPGMGWPWISGPETELVDKSVFRLNRTFLWGSMLFSELLSSLGDLVAPSQKHFTHTPANSFVPLPPLKEFLRA